MSETPTTEHSTSDHPEGNRKESRHNTEDYRPKDYQAGADYLAEYNAEFPLMSPKTDLTRWKIGPFHASLPASMILNLVLDGEVISRCSVETGFLHKGLEKALELSPWSSLVPYADHLDPENAVFGELVVCTAVEEIAALEVPLRARVIRLILSELTRISAHLSYTVRLARSVGSDTIVHYVLRDRERILDLFELLTGSRFSLNFLRFGGVKADVTEGFIERVLEICELIKIRLKEYNDIFTYNFSFTRRTYGVAVLPVDMIQKCGITGPNARASGIILDLRKSSPALGYDRIDFQVPIGRGESGALGDIHDRYLVRLREIGQSIEILKQLTEIIPPGDFLEKKLENDIKIPTGEAYSQVESPRGLLGCHIVSDGSGSPNRVQFRTPTISNLLCIPELIPGTRIEDLPVVLASLDLGIAEADR